jgi:hypothetical protein
MAQSGGFSSGKILSTTFSLFFSNFFSFVVLTTLIFSPYILFSLAMVATLDTGSPSRLQEQIMIWLVVSSILALILAPIASASLTYGVFQRLRGAEASMGKCLQVGISRLFPLIGVAILAGLAIVGGMILFIVPGIIFALMFSVAGPTTVVEKMGVVASLKRSKELTYGYKGTIFVVMFVLGLIQSVISNILQATVGPNSLQMFMVVNVIFVVVWQSLSVVAPVVIYYELRKAKESIDLQQLAAVFD